MDPPDAELPDAEPADFEAPDAGLTDADPFDAAPPVCGDEQIGPGETCDDGNRRIGDGCDADCQLECGNGQLDPGEACEDGNREPGDGCDAECRRECGNGQLDGDEACDDGNRDSGDGCDALCRVEQQPGPGEACPELICAAPFECWGVADLNFANYCLKPCAEVADCVADFGDAVCCQPPGPQLLDTFCVPHALLQDPCGE